MLYKEIGVQKLYLRYNRSKKYLKPYEVICEKLISVPYVGVPRHYHEREQIKLILVDSFDSRLKAETFIKQLEGLEII